MTEPATLLSHQETIDDFPRDQRHENPRFGRGIQEPDEPHHGVQEAHVQRADSDGPHISRAWRRGVTGLNHDRADQGGGEFQAETEVRPRRRCFQDPADAGQLDGGEKIL